MSRTQSRNVTCAYKPKDRVSIRPESADKFFASALPYRREPPQKPCCYLRAALTNSNRGAVCIPATVSYKNESRLFILRRFPLREKNGSDAEAARFNTLCRCDSHNDFDAGHQSAIPARVSLSHYYYSKPNRELKHFLAHTMLRRSPPCFN